MFPAFTNAALLAGLGAIAAPILIHLLLRRKSQRMRFSTIQFFIKKDEQSMRKRKLRNLFLLSLRLLIFALLALAFARPFLPNSLVAANGAKRQQAILLLDTSASMQAVVGGRSQWERAKTAAREILAKMSGEDRAALVLCSSRSSTASGFVPPSVLARKIDDLAPSLGSADLSDGLQQALKFLPTANPAFETSLHVISDLQRVTAQNMATVPLPQNLKLTFTDLSERFTPNVAVTDLALERRENNPAQARITSFSDENYAGLTYTLRIDGKDALQGSVPLPAGSSTNLPLALPALKPGWHSAEFIVQPKDGLPLDDHRFASLLVPDPIRVLVVESRPSSHAYQEESFFVAAALNPSPEAEASASRFKYEKITIDVLSAKLSAQPGQPPVRLVVLPSLKQLPPAASQALASFVESGGGALFFLGDSVSANAYNTTFGNLLPAELDRVEPAGEAGWHLGKFNPAAPAFSLFNDPANGNLTLHEFTKRFALKPRPGAAISAEFDDGTPFVLERTSGQGRIILVNSSADTRWTDWQKHKSFVPWLHSTAFYLSGIAPSEQGERSPVFNSGADVDIPITRQEATLTLLSPAGHARVVQADHDGVVRDLPLAEPGIYTFKDPAGVEFRRIAANVPNAESDLAFAAPAETERQIVRRAEEAPTTLAAGLFSESPKGRELWRALLLLALLFMAVEPIVANRTAA